MISFFEEDVKFPLKGKRKVTKAFIKDLLKSEGKTEGDINFIFCSNDYLLNINRQYLDHDYYTDVITFDYVDNEVISGDIFISTDMITTNAETYSVSFNHELYRVVFHGVLHLCGYADKLPADEQLMRSKEDFYLTHNKIQ